MIIVYNYNLQIIIGIIGIITWERTDKIVLADFGLLFFYRNKNVPGETDGSFGGGVTDLKDFKVFKALRLL